MLTRNATFRSARGHASDTAAGSDPLHDPPTEGRARMLRHETRSQQENVTDNNDEVLVRAEGLYKVFGRRTHEAVEKLRAGTARNDIEGVTAAVIDAS